MQTSAHWVSALHQHAQDVHDWNPRLAGKMHGVISINHDGLEQLFACSRVQRLVGLAQHGVKFLDGRKQPEYHRLRHSVHVGSTGMLLALKCGFSWDKSLLILVAGLLHDVGHCAFTHDGEQVLQWAGGWCHEEAGQRLILEDSEIINALTALGLSSSSALALIREEGRLGRLQSIADTLSYVIDDCRAAGMAVPMTLKEEVVTSLMGTDEHRGLAVNDPTPFQTIINLRAKLTERVYRSHDAELIQKAFACLMFEAIQDNVLTIDEIANGTDAPVETKLDRYRAHENPRLRSVFQIAKGQVSVELSKWKWEHYADEDLPRSGTDGTLRFSKTKVSRQMSKKTILVTHKGRQIILRLLERDLPTRLYSFRYRFVGAQ